MTRAERLHYGFGTSEETGIQASWSHVVRRYTNLVKHPDDTLILDKGKNFLTEDEETGDDYEACGSAMADG